jgi:hypothetical protein
MLKRTQGVAPIGDPYAFLALNILDEAFRTIRCYFSGSGSKDELIEGKRALRWMKKMEGTFKLVASASNMPVDNLHQLCMWKINEIRREVFVEISTVGRKNQQG